MVNIIEVELGPDAAIFTEPEGEQAKLQNLLLNMMGGLEYQDLTPDEKSLLQRNGWKNENDK